jgi:hypothetical protein
MHWYALHRNTRLVLRRQGNVVRQRARHGCILSRRSDISTQIIDGIIFIFFFLTQLLWSFRSCLYGLDQPFRVTRSSRFARPSNGSRISTDRRRRGNVFFSQQRLNAMFYWLYCPPPSSPIHTCWYFSYTQKVMSRAGGGKRSFTHSRSDVV